MLPRILSATFFALAWPTTIVKYFLAPPPDDMECGCGGLVVAFTILYGVPFCWMLYHGLRYRTLRGLACATLMLCVTLLCVMNLGRRVDVSPLPIAAAVRVGRFFATGFALFALARACEYMATPTHERLRRPGESARQALQRRRRELFRP